MLMMRLFPVVALLLCVTLGTGTRIVAPKPSISSSAAHYTQVQPAISSSMFDVTGFGGNYVVVGGACSPDVFLTLSFSSDLKNWNNQDRTDVPHGCNTINFGKGWNAASDPSLGYVVWNDLSYYTSADGEKWTWHNNTLLNTLAYIYCSGKGSCIGGVTGNSFSWVYTTDLLTWKPFAAMKTQGGFISVVNNQFLLIDSNSNLIYSFNSSLPGWQLQYNLTAQLEPFKGLYLFDITEGPNNGFLLLGTFLDSFYKGLFSLASDGKTVQDIAMFESNAVGMYYNDGALLTYSSTAYNVTTNLGAIWNSYACFPYGADPYKQCSAKLVNGNFVVLGDDAVFTYSADGKIWTTVPSVTSGVISGVTTKGNTFYLFSSYSTTFGTTVNVYTSTDGSKWTSATSFTPPANIAYMHYPVYYESIDTWLCVFFNDSSYQNFPRISTDLTNWDPMKWPVPETKVASVAFGNGIWMLSGSDESYTYSMYFMLANSTTGTWSTKTPPKPAEYSAPVVLFGNGIFVILSGNYTMTTTNAQTWAQSEAPTGCNYMQFVSGLFFCGTAFSPPQSVSKDGSTWTATKYSTTPPGRPVLSSAILFDGSQYLVTYSFNAIMFTSPDGINWSQAPTVSYLGLQFSAYANNVAVLGGNENNEVFVSQ